MSEANKQVAVKFLQLVVARKIDEAYQKYVDLAGKHHNAYFPAGFPALREAMKEAHQKFPHTQLHIKNIIGEGDLVAVFSHVVHEAGQKGVAVTHIFRFQNGKIVEMWDVGQPVSENSPNQDGPF